MATQFNFSDIFGQLQSRVADLAKDTVNDYITDAKNDAQGILTNMKNELQHWTTQLVKGELTPGDFEWLVKARKDSIKMAALEQKGLAMIRIDQFKASVLNIIVDTVFSVVKL